MWYSYRYLLFFVTYLTTTVPILMHIKSAFKRADFKRQSSHLVLPFSFPRKEQLRPQVIQKVLWHHWNSFETASAARTKNVTIALALPQNLVVARDVSTLKSRRIIFVKFFK